MKNELESVNLFQMAAKRIAKSAVDWVAFAERVPVNQRDAFRAFKAHSEAFVAKYVII